MLKNKPENRFIITFLITLIFYAILDFIFTDWILYVVGGFIGMTLKFIGGGGDIQFAVAWLVLLTIFTGIFYGFYNYKVVKYLTIPVIFCLLYIIDVTRYLLLPYDTKYMEFGYWGVAICVFIKADILSILLSANYLTRSKALI